MALDESAASLKPLWRWVLAQPNRDGLLEDQNPQAPPWYPFRAVYCHHYDLQASLVRVIDGVAAYYPAYLQAAQPERPWKIGGTNARDTRYAHYKRAGAVAR